MESGTGLIHSLGRHLSRNGKYELTEANLFTQLGIDLSQSAYNESNKYDIREIDNTVNTESWQLKHTIG